MRFLVLALLVALAPAASAQVAVLVPVDEAAADPSFVTFRSGLLRDIAARDTAAVLGVFAADATVSFGAESSGAAGIREMWFGPDPFAGADFWATLARTVSLGSAVDGDLVAAPYLFLRFPAEHDAFSHVAVTGESVRVRATPSRTGTVLGSVSYAVLPVETEPSVFVEDWSDWTPVRLATGESGWIASDYVRSPIDYRAGFVKGPRGWRISFFVAGD